jgi:hypothetical protein
MKQAPPPPNEQIQFLQQNHINLFGANAIVACMQSETHLIEELGHGENASVI